MTPFYQYKFSRKITNQLLFLRSLCYCYVVAVAAAVLCDVAVSLHIKGKRSSVVFRGLGFQFNIKQKASLSILALLITSYYK